MIHRRLVGAVLAALVVMSALGGLVGCTAAIQRLTSVAVPSLSSMSSPTAAAPEPNTATAAGAARPAPSLTVQAAASQEVGTASITAASPIVVATASPSAAPSSTGGPVSTQTQPALNLVYARGASILRAGYLGEDARPAATIAELDAFCFDRGTLAIAQGRRVELLDLSRGSRRTIELSTKVEPEYAAVFFGASGTTLLHVAMVPDDKAKALGRSLELRVLAMPDGTQRSLGTVRDTAGADLLFYDEEAGQVVFMLAGGEQGRFELRRYSAKTGDLASSMLVESVGDAVLSPDGRYLMTQRQSRDGADLLIYDLTQPKSPPGVYRHPQNTLSASHVWSPDGRLISYLLRETKSYTDPPTRGLGLWVLDVTTMRATLVLDESATQSLVVGWTPDSAQILALHRADARDAYYYVVRPDGGGRRILSLPPDAEVLGWMPQVDAWAPPAVEVDPWQVQLARSANDPGIAAQVLAQYILTRTTTDDQTLNRQVRDLFQRAGWKPGDAAPTLRCVAGNTFVAQLPPLGIYVLEDGRAQAIAQGQVVLDARTEGSDLGLVFAAGGAAGAQGATLQPAFVLFRREPDRTWRMLWSPQGQRDWIATDGQIRLSAQGLQAVQVSGTSFGLVTGDDEVFSECYTCPHRSLSATWVRRGDTYLRETRLAAGAMLADVLWEMTGRRPYAVLHELVRRMRKGTPADDLADVRVQADLRSAGVLDKDIRLIPYEESGSVVRWSVATTGQRYQASVQDGRVLRIERIAK